MAEVLDDEAFGGEVALFVSSGLICLFAAGIAYKMSRSLILSAATVLVVAILNPVIARVSVAAAEFFHRAAFPDTYSPWNRGVKAWGGAFWPVILLFWIVIFIFFVSINRLFR